MSSKKKFKRVILHAGLGKTGTSSIQNQLLEHAKVLESEHSIHFPRVFRGLHQPFNGNHSSLLGFMFIDHNGPPRSHSLAGFRSEKEAEEYSSKIRTDFENGFSSSSASNLLISAEGLGHFSKPRLILLSNWLQKFAEDIEVIVCIRHPMAALSSEIQQRLTLGFVLEDLYEQPPRYRFKQLFDRLETAFPQSKFVVYDFSRATEYPAGLVGCFYEKIGLDARLVPQQSKYKNESMSHEAALLLSALNATEPLIEGGKINRNRSPRAIQYFQKIPGKKYQAPRAVYQMLEREISDDLAWLLEHRGIDLGAITINHRSEYRSFSETSVRSIAVRLGKLRKYGVLPRVIEKITKKSR